jgi:two-component sensor histidine kinase
MNLGVKDKGEIISVNILRIKSIAIIHELVYEQGNFTNISVAETVKKVLYESFLQERIQDINIEIKSDDDHAEFNINQAVTLSLLISEMIFEIFRYKGDDKLIPNEDVKVEIIQNEVNILIKILNNDLTRVTSLLLEVNEQNFSEIFRVLAKQLGAKIEIDQMNGFIQIEFECRDVKGSSSALPK